MNDNQRPGLGKKLGTILSWAALIYLFVQFVGWLLGRKWGAFLIVAIFGAVILIGDAVSVITGETCADRTWFWSLCAIAAVIMAIAQWQYESLYHR